MHWNAVSWLMYSWSKNWIQINAKTKNLNKSFAEEIKDITLKNTNQTLGN